MHGGLQAQQQVAEPSLAGPRQVGVQAAALLPQVQLAGFSQRVADPVVLRDQLLAGGQGVPALRGGEEGGAGSVSWSVTPSAPHPAAMLHVPSLTWPLQTCG